MAFSDQNHVIRNRRQEKLINDDTDLGYGGSPGPCSPEGPRSPASAMPACIYLGRLFSVELESLESLEGAASLTLYTKNIHPFDPNTAIDGDYEMTSPRSWPSYMEVVNSKREMLALVKDLKDEFAAKNRKTWKGLVFSRSNFAMAVVGKEGAILSFSNGPTTLDIPEDALEVSQIIYFYRPVCLDAAVDRKEGPPFIPCGPLIHLGPEGTKFKKPVRLTFGHCAAKVDRMRALERLNEAAPWGEIEQTNITVSGETMTVSLTHFTDVIPGSSSGSRTMRLVTLVKRQENGDMTMDVFLLPNVPGFIQDVLFMIYDAHAGREVRTMNVVIDPSKAVVVEFDAGALVSLRNTITFPVDRIEPSCHATFTLRRLPQTGSGQKPATQQSAAAASSSTLLASISVSQCRNMPLATIEITDSAHQIKVTNDQLYPNVVERATLQETSAEVKTLDAFKGPEDAREFAVSRNLSISDCRRDTRSGLSLAPEEGESRGIGNVTASSPTASGRSTRHASGADLEEDGSVPQSGSNIVADTNIDGEAGTPEVEARTQHSAPPLANEADPPRAAQRTIDEGQAITTVITDIVIHATDETALEAGLPADDAAGGVPQALPVVCPVHPVDSAASPIHEAAKSEPVVDTAAGINDTAPPSPKKRSK